MTKVPDRKIPLDTVAETLKVHPRTVLRALKGEVNTYWAEGHKVDILLSELGRAYDFDTQYFERVLRGKDELFKPREAAEFLDIQIRVFKYRTYPALIRRGGVVRYSRRILASYHVEHYI